MGWQDVLDDLRNARTSTDNLDSKSLLEVAQELGVYKPYKGGSYALYEAELQAAVNRVLGKEYFPRPKPTSPKVTSAHVEGLKDLFKPIDEALSNLSAKAVMEGDYPSSRPPSFPGSQQDWDEASDEVKEAWAKSQLGVKQSFEETLRAEYEETFGAEKNEYDYLMGGADPMSPAQRYDWMTKMLVEERGAPESGNFFQQQQSNFVQLPASRKRKTITPSGYVARMRTMTPGLNGELHAYQRALYAAGFYGSAVGGRDNEPTWGAPDMPTVLATRLVAGFALEMPQYTIPEIISMFTKAVDTDGDGVPDAEEKARPPKPTVEHVNPLDLQIAAQDLSVSLTGQRITDADARGLTSGYANLETQAAMAAYNDQEGGGGGSVNRPPTPGAYAEQRLREERGGEIGAYSYLQTFHMLLDRLGLRN